MNIQQYMAMKQELAATVTLVRALAAELDRVKEEVHDIKQRHPQMRPVGRPPKEQVNAL